MAGGVIPTALESTPQTAASHVAAREQRAARWPRSCGACVTSTRGFWRIDFDWKRRRLRTCARAGASLRHAMWRFRGPLSSGGRTRATRAPGGRLWCAGRDLALILCSADCTCRWTARRRQIRWNALIRWRAATTPLRDRQTPRVVPAPPPDRSPGLRWLARQVSAKCEIFDLGASMHSLENGSSQGDSSNAPVRSRLPRSVAWTPYFSSQNTSAAKTTVSEPDFLPSRLPRRPSLVQIRAHPHHAAVNPRVVALRGYSGPRLPP